MPTNQEREVDPARWVETHADVLYRYAIARVGQCDLAEDLVQDALLAALQARQTFRGDSTERTWLIGILRHKMIDHFRSARVRRERQPSVDDDGRVVESMFDERGRWRHPPGSWVPQPEQLLENREFWGAVTACLQQMPDRPREVFTMRVLGELKSEAVCKELGISSTNLWVVLHRARAMLRSCLEKHWFEKR